MVEGDLEDGKLRLIRPQATPEPVRLLMNVAWRAAHPPGPAARWMTEHLVTAWRTEEGTAPDAVFKAAS